MEHQVGGMVAVRLSAAIAPPARFLAVLILLLWGRSPSDVEGALGIRVETRRITEIELKRIHRYLALARRSVWISMLVYSLLRTILCLICVMPLESSLRGSG